MTERDARVSPEPDPRAPVCSTDEGGDPPCWAHLVGDGDEPGASPGASPTFEDRSQAS